MSEPETWKFNFGPIGRTEASGLSDQINLASLTLHETLNALMAATNRDEFVEWLWHDLFKPAFYFIPRRKNPKEPEWHHNPGLGAFQQGLDSFANTTGTTGKYVKTHHWRSNREFTISENVFGADQFEQINLGNEARFIQLSFGIEPGLTTALVRAVIADAFIKIVTEGVAEALRNQLAKNPKNFDKVRFKFNTQLISKLTFSNPPTDQEIWDNVGKHFDVDISGNELIQTHLTPIQEPGNSYHETEVIVDLTGKMPLPEQLFAEKQPTLSLAEFLVVYQDSRTLILTIPQEQIYQLEIPLLKQLTYQTACQKLKELNAIVSDKDGTNYLEVAFAEEKQIEIRIVPKQIETRPTPKHLIKLIGQTMKVRPIDRILGRPVELLNQMKSVDRVCRLCGSTFDSKLKPFDSIKGFSGDFTDTEHIGQTKDTCPLCRLYILNSPAIIEGKKRTVLRGAFALVLPSSHFGSPPGTDKPKERPPLDIWGRFKEKLNRVTITTQEFTLFQQISRRIVAHLWHEIEPAAQLPLPYLGAILLTHREEQTQQYIRKLLPKFSSLFRKVQLRAYPFEIDVAPAVEVAFDVSIGDDKHISRHTYLKTRPATLPVHPDSRLFVLLNNHFQIELSAKVFEAVKNLQFWTEKMGSTQRDYWLKQILSGSDPISAFYEMTKATTKSQTVESTAFNYAGKYWETLAQDSHDLSQVWQTYEEIHAETREILNRYPFLVNLLSTLKERSNE